MSPLSHSGVGVVLSVSLEDECDVSAQSRGLAVDGRGGVRHGGGHVPLGFGRETCPPSAWGGGHVSLGFGEGDMSP